MILLQHLNKRSTGMFDGAFYRYPCTGNIYIMSYIFGFIKIVNKTRDFFS